MQREMGGFQWEETQVCIYINVCHLLLGDTNK